MTDRALAAELADEIEHGDPSGLVEKAMRVWSAEDRRVMLAALRAYARPPQADAGKMLTDHFGDLSEMVALRVHASHPLPPDDVRERATQAMRVRNGCADHHGCEAAEEPDGCACRLDAETVLAAIRPGDDLGGGLVVALTETTTPQNLVERSAGQLDRWLAYDFGEETTK